MNKREDKKEMIYTVSKHHKILLKGKNQSGEGDEIPLTQGGKVNI